MAARAFRLSDLENNAVLVENGPVVGEMVRVHGRCGLYRVRGIDRTTRTIHVTRNLPRNPIKEGVPFEAVRRLHTRTAQMIFRFLNPECGNT